MKKYYYDDPISAAYMAKNFDFQIMGSPHHIFEHWKDIAANYATGGKYYLHPDSVKLLEPQEDDLCDFEEVACCDCGTTIWEFGKHSGKVKQIIERNNKPFIMPKEETA